MNILTIVTKISSAKVCTPSFKWQWVKDGKKMVVACDFYAKRAFRQVRAKARAISAKEK